MSYEFLRSYVIPGKNDSVQFNPEKDGNEEPLPSPPPIASGFYGQELEATSIHTQMATYPPVSNRFIPPSKYGTDYTPPVSRPQKRKYNCGPGTNLERIPETTADGQLVLFQGRDISYPDELNKRIHPLNCELCNTKMNSLHSAKDHYESKSHDRNISTWLFKNYAEKGLGVPVVNRFIKDGVSGPEAYHCELCDLKLTSVMHANQHYSGRKHRLVANKISKPSGAGYYDADGKWVRTGTKLVPTSNNGRVSIGEGFEIILKTTSSSPSTTAAPSTIVETSPANMRNVKDDATLICQICNVSVTSSTQMAMHERGAKHRKKLLLGNVEEVSLATNVQKSLNEPIENSEPAPTALGKESELNGNLSMYRTPTGSYYCKTCNTTVCRITALQQHLIGKKHLKKSADEKVKTCQAQQKIESKLPS